MPNEFDQIIRRRNNYSLKWDAYPANVLPLWVADMDFRAPEVVLRALRDRVDHGIFGYESEIKKLREAFMDWADRHYQWKIKAEEILFMPGVVTGLNLAAQALSEPGNGVIIQPPVYPPFFSVSRNANLVRQEAPLMANDKYYYIIDFDRFEYAIDPHTRLFILCNPHNPVGRVFNLAELKRLAELCIKHHLIIISDEIHCDLVYEGQRHIPIASIDNEISRQTVTLVAPSKTFNIAGLKSSMMIVQDPKMREILERGRRGLVGEPSIMGLLAALAAYTDGEKWLENLLKYLLRNRDYLKGYIAEHLPQMNMPVPEGTYLAWLDCRKYNLKPDPYEFLFSQAKVALNDGRAFGAGGEGFIRLNFGCPLKTLTEALDRMKSAIQKTFK